MNLHLRNSGIQRYKMKILQFDWYEHSSASSWSLSNEDSLSGCQVTHIGIQYPRAFPLYQDLQTPHDVAMRGSDKEYLPCFESEYGEQDSIAKKLAVDFTIKISSKKSDFKINRNCILEFDESFNSKDITIQSNLSDVPFGTLIEIGYEKIV